LLTEVIERLRDAQNGHGLDAFVACLDPGIAASSRCIPTGPVQHMAHGTE
jgi:hypothetical protein